MSTASPNALLRLRKHADYQRVYAGSRKQWAKQIAYFFAMRPVERRSDTPGPRIGLTVPKALGKAHERNRIKRRMRELVRRHAGLLGGQAVDVILHPRRSVLEVPHAELSREVETVFRAIGRGLNRKPAGAGMNVAPPAPPAG